MRVLLFTDDPVLPEFLRRPLEPLGHRLMLASSSAAFRTALESSVPDAVLLPRRLPDSDPGVELQHIREHPSCGDVSIILITLGSDRIEQDKELNVDGRISVPFSDADILAAINVSERAKRLILIVDDSQLIHSLTPPILEEAGYEVASAYDGAEGLKLARERRPDLIISDVEMPKMDGYELCRLVKEDPNTAHIPVLISSTLGESQDLERGFDAGADDYMVKPVIAVELLTRTKQLLAESMPATREHILVVDDSPAQRHYVADCLARQGFRISTAENGRGALEMVLAEAPHLVVSDYEMPEMTGFELVHSIRSNAQTRNTPVIMLTARDSKRDMAQMRAAGASAYLVKPFAQDKCIATVERTLAERRLLDYKIASSVYISQGAQAAAEERALSGEMSSIRAQEEDIAILFSDLAGFTSMSLNMTPREVIELLNNYFDLMCPLIVELDGDIDKFIGDAIMAVFPELPGMASPAERATRAAMQMQACMPAFNEGRPVGLAMRIGINTGPVVRGDLGSAVVRRDYTVIGDTVNRANRYEMNCPVGSVLISQSTRDILGDCIEVTAHEGLILKGVEPPVVGYEVTNISSLGDSQRGDQDE
ncbi:MAG: response regulator [Myxococcales bacterium]|nr:response regulator [Myxococcales bacterium]